MYQGPYKILALGLKQSWLGPVCGTAVLPIMHWLLFMCCSINSL